MAKTGKRIAPVLENSFRSNMPRQKQLKILIFPSKGTVLPFILEDIAIALTQHGHKVGVFPLKDKTFDYDYAKRHLP